MFGSLGGNTSGKDDGAGQSIYSVFTYRDIKGRATFSYGEEFLPWRLKFYSSLEREWSDTPQLFDPATTLLQGDKPDDENAIRQGCNFYYGWQPWTYHSMGSYDLSQNKPVSDYDLSTDGGKHAMTTANCYMIDRPGTYRLPLVYGNAIVNGRPNTLAYTNPSETYPAHGYNIYIKKSLPDLYDQPIKSPYIYGLLIDCNDDGGCSYSPIKHAELIWQSEKGLISEVGLSPDKKYLTFTTSSGYGFKEGNAVVGVFSKDLDGHDKIVWYWHIWITHLRPYDDDVEVYVNGYKEQKRILPVSVGTVFNRGYDEVGEIFETAKVCPDGELLDDPLLTYEEGRSELYICLYRPPVPLEEGRKCLYQFGSMIPYPVEDNAFAPFYDMGGKVKNIYKNPLLDNFGNLISVDIYLDTRNQAPTQFYTTNLSSFVADNHFPQDLWNLGHNDDFNRFTKTIYDPSPVGYRVSRLACCRSKYIYKDDYSGRLYMSGYTHRNIRLDLPIGDTVVHVGSVWYLPTAASISERGVYEDSPLKFITSDFLDYDYAYSIKTPMVYFKPESLTYFTFSQDHPLVAGEVICEREE